MHREHKAAPRRRVTAARTTRQRALTPDSNLTPGASPAPSTTTTSVYGSGGGAGAASSASGGFGAVTSCGDAAMVAGMQQNAAKMEMMGAHLAESRADALKQEAELAAPSRHLALQDVRLPLEVGMKVMCKWRDGVYRLVRVVDRRPGAHSEDPAQWMYYVHYYGFNRRLDEWVVLEQMDLTTVEVVPMEETGPDGKPQKRRKVAAEEHDSDSEHAEFDANALREHEEFTKVKNIEVIELGRHLMETWYFSPFPPEYKDCKKLYFCEFSLHFFKRRSQMLRHVQKCRLRNPPGEEIYRSGGVSMFEVDGKKERYYCQNLAFLAKLFLDHKTLYYDVDLFLFYILCEIDERGAHIVGYFSKEKDSDQNYNLACILTLPAYQRKGYGKFLIAMSYELSKLEGKVGTPERPLSDLGKVSYLGYWTRILLGILKDAEGSMSVKDLSTMTAIRVEDIIWTLQTIQLIQYSKGQHVICAEPKLIEKCLKAAGSPGLVVDPSKIVWTPYNAEREYANVKG